jgi:hypothetical protein
VAANIVQIDGAIPINQYYRNYSYADIVAGMPILSQGLSTDLNRVVYKNSSGTAFKVMLDSSEGTNLADGLVMVTANGGKCAVSSVTGTVLGYLGNVTSDIQAQINGKEPTFAAGTTAQYLRGDKTFQTLNTTVVPEGTNLYHTTARARTSLAATSPIAYNSSTGMFTHVDSTTIRHVTDTEKSTWNGKQSAITGIATNALLRKTAGGWASSIAIDDGTNFVVSSEGDHQIVGSSIDLNAGVDGVKVSGLVCKSVGQWRMVFGRPQEVGRT